MSEWKPIETAPECCLVLCAGDIFDAYKNINGDWKAPDPSGGGDYYLGETPTHWMPRPDYPDGAK